MAVTGSISDLQTAYDIGTFIISEASKLGDDPEGPWVEYKGHFESGPNPYYFQMKQGIILQVTNGSHKPDILLTRFGTWKLLGGCYGNLEKVFNAFWAQADLEELYDHSTQRSTLWAVRKWKGREIEEPIVADPRHEFIPTETVRQLYQQFIASLPTTGAS